MRGWGTIPCVYWSLTLWTWSHNQCGSDDSLCVALWVFDLPPERIYMAEQWSGWERGVLARCGNLDWLYISSKKVHGLQYFLQTWSSDILIVIWYQYMMVVINLSLSLHNRICFSTLKKKKHKEINFICTSNTSGRHEQKTQGTNEKCTLWKTTTSKPLGQPRWVMRSQFYNRASLCVYTQAAFRQNT